MELIEIIRWVSIVLMWAVCGLNIYVAHGNMRVRKGLDILVEEYRKATLELKEAKQAYEEAISDGERS